MENSLLSFQMMPEALPPPTPETIQLVRSKLGINEDKIKEALQHLKDWLELQPHLPKDYGTESNIYNSYLLLNRNYHGNDI